MKDAVEGEYLVAGDTVEFTITKDPFYLPRKNLEILFGGAFKEEEEDEE